MPLIEAVAKAVIKQKLKIARDNVTDADEALDALVDALWEVAKYMKDNATVTGTCPNGGGPLTAGKIT